MMELMDGGSPTGPGGIWEVTPTRDAAPGGGGASGVLLFAFRQSRGILWGVVSLGEDCCGVEMFKGEQAPSP